MSNPPPNLPPGLPVDAEVLQYQSGDGLLSVVFLVERGSTGRMMPPVDIWEDTVPLMAGSRYRGARHAARSFVLPIITGGNRYGRDQLRHLARTLDPLRGMGTLRQVVIAQGPDAYQGRQISCVYQAGLDSLVEEYPQFSRAALMFRATDPYWKDNVIFERDFTPAAIESEWFPIFPLDLSSTNVNGRFSITNTGDAEAWPSTEAHGPGSNFSFANLTTGAYYNVAGDVPDGSTLRVTTEPGKRAVMLDGANWFSHLDRASTLWPLVPGVNDLQVTYTTVSARVVVHWQLRYLTP